MGRGLSVEVLIESVAVDPTGEECGACGEIPWLHAFEFAVFVDGRPVDSIYVCPDCAAIIKEYACPT